MAKIGEKLNHTPEITEWSIDLTNPNKTLLIKSSLTDDKIITLVSEAGFKAEKLA